MEKPKDSGNPNSQKVQRMAPVLVTKQLIDTAAMSSTSSIVPLERDQPKVNKDSTYPLIVHQKVIIIPSLNTIPSNTMDIANSHHSTEKAIATMYKPDTNWQPTSRRLHSTLKNSPYRNPLSIPVRPKLTKQVKSQPKKTKRVKHIKKRKKRKKKSTK